MYLNKVMLIGRLGKNPEVNYIQPDLPVAKFSLATSEYYKDKAGNKVENTEWHNIVAWRGTAKFIENYLNKGMLVYIEGKLQTRRWESQDGTARYVTEIVVDIIRVLERRDTRDYNQNTKAQNTENDLDNTEKQETQDLANKDEDFVDGEFENKTDDEDIPF
ncbi:MAG: single-stranded DNA-binding protein [Bacteroidales bacterium]|jgi:single-strand DNA-binding protein|nr:single-stranded DNA-binding protein [Bacteroidales bacterium]MCK9498433.1 single-stranded DNA-binding protein [Bacteroidales bacterium]MDY0315954.1 single-stranded DNA-binding protein [Bacteroidales bacterium]NLB85890.1 single-stranded DNA-binding protein [Bacteroidales bacterium]